jgi:predicted lactoylglutathione lyase
MADVPATLCLPIADRPASLAFYRDGLGLEAFGPIADDGVPEPLQLTVSAGLVVMLIPSGGFGWVIGDHEVAAPPVSECLVSLAAADEAEVDRRVARAVAAGARVVVAPDRRPWGYLGTVADLDGHLWQFISVP